MSTLGLRLFHLPAQPPVPALMSSKNMERGNRFRPFAVLTFFVLIPGTALLQAVDSDESEANALVTTGDIGPCAVTLAKASNGLIAWSPDGRKYIVNQKDQAGIYQLYVGSTSENPICITCTSRPNSPLASRHKLQPRWHPSGKWISLAGEREHYDKPIIWTPDLLEGWIQSGLWVDIYMTTPDGESWQQLSNFANQRGDGFTGVAFTPDGTRAVWAQIVDGNIFEALFGRWELMLADVRQDLNGTPTFTNHKNITPAGAKWVEVGNFAPDGKSLLITSDAGLSDPQGMDQFILDISTGNLRNLTNSPKVWDEHGVFSPSGNKILFMSSYPFRDNPSSHSVLSLKTEFMLMNSDGSGLQQLTHFNAAGHPESNAPGRGSVAANGSWHPNGRLISALNLFFPGYETWNLFLDSSCGIGARTKPDRAPPALYRR